ncbi:hypothetical protein [Rothia sp. LK2492]|uniref:hypothetical protein n=1 Tax=Rothia sp. LK2492 TaxID=3114370 RepID=UPI0034CE4C5D
MNPARTLDNLYTKWSNGEKLGNRIVTGRQEIRKEALAELHTAVRSLVELDHYFDLMEHQGRDVKKYRLKMSNYIKAVFDSCNNLSQIDAFARNLMPFLADVIDSLTGQALKIRVDIEEHAESLDSQVASLIQSFLDDDSLDPTFRNHAVMLCKHIQENIRNIEDAGYFDFSESVRLLGVYVSAAAERSTNGTFKEAFRKFNEEFLKHPLAPYALTSTAAFLGMKELG